MNTEPKFRDLRKSVVDSKLAGCMRGLWRIHAFAFIVMARHFFGITLYWRLGINHLYYSVGMHASSCNAIAIRAGY